MSDRDLTDNLVSEGSKSSYNAIEAEKALLALCMRNKDALGICVGKRLVAQDFSDSRHVYIYEAISKLYLDNVTPTRITVCEKLETDGNISKAGGDQYVYAVANVQSVIAGIDSYIRVVTANASSRKLVNTLTDLTNLARSRKNSVNDIIDVGVGRLNDLKDTTEDDGFEKLSSILRRNLKELHDTAFGDREQKAVKTGFRYLDNITGGFRPGTINIIAARPGMGKTALVLNIAKNVAGIYSKPVAIFSLEMSKSEIANRILASMSKTSFKAIERADITREEEAELNNTFAKISPLPIYIDEQTDTNPMDIMAKCKELQTKIPLGLVIIDYLQLMTYPGRYSGSRQNEIADISRSLKILAKELKLPVIALSQLNRGTENREDGDHIPGLADIRDSGAIEQDADCVIFIHRPDYYNKNKEKKKIEDAQLIVAKNRHGATDTAFVKWMGERTLFFEADRPDDPKDPNSSAYTRTTDSQSAASDYSFEEAPLPPEPPEAEIPEPPDADDEEAFVNDENEDFFSDSNTDFPDNF